MKVDRTKIDDPNITLTNAAYEQLNLIIENDFTLQDKVIRLSIDGKKCEGFTYALGFDDGHDDDFIVHLKDLRKPIHLDPFCAHYLNKALINYVHDPSTEEEGFIITNEEQHKFQKKFWLNDSESLLPLE